MATTISKIERQAEQAAARAEYIQTAVVALHGDHAEVASQFDPEESYRVQIEGGLPVGCNCKDFYWRSKRNPGHVCKHMEATDLCLSATLPLMNTPAMKSLIKALDKTFRPAKVRRSAPNAQLITSLQVAEGVRVRKIRRDAKKNAGVLVVKKVVAPIVELSPVCLPIAA
jgi:hypothetical protein